MFNGPEYDRNGKIDQAKYTSEEYDFYKIMYGDKDENITPLSHYSSKNKYTQSQNQDEPKIYCRWGKFGWFFALFGCFCPIISSIVNCDGEYMGGCISFTIILLVCWVFAYANRAE